MKTTKNQFALCLDNSDYQASLICGKVYPVIPDPQAAKDGFLRVVDEDGEDYLFPGEKFALVDFPRPVVKKLLALAAA
jgi:hypothetical protein